jgi:predicted Mrr-cat superfamily restriction endonuclease
MFPTIGWVVTAGGQMFRFIKVMKTGDLVAVTTGTYKTETFQG